MLRLKICCISSTHEARMAIAAGADALGLVGPMPSGPGVIDAALSARIARQTPPPIATFLLTSETAAEALIAHARLVQPSVLQLVDAVAPAVYAPLREALPALKLVQVLHVLDERNVEEVLAAAPHVDALLLDSGNPTLAVKQLGGTGRRHDWKISRKIVESVGVPVFLAGGLNAGNLREAIETVQPFGIDVCSGVRTDGKLDAEKLAEFVRLVKA